MYADVHVVPVADLVDHDERRDCWCGPRVERPCPECDDGEAVDGCWRCGSTGVVDADADQPAVVVHNAADGRP